MTCEMKARQKKTKKLYMHNEMKLYMIYAATASCPRRGAALFPLPSSPALEHDKQFKVIMYNFRIYAQA